MGQCQSEKSISITNPTTISSKTGKNKNKVVQRLPSDKNNKEIVSVPEQYNIMISYCWAEKQVCHRLADRLLQDKFTVSIDRDNMSGDLHTAMANAIDNSDYILLCISEAYFNCVNCQKEARYASDRRKTIIPIKVTQKYKTEGWLSFIIAGKLYFQISESEHDFNLTYTKIVQEILGHTKEGPLKALVERVAPTSEAVAERENIYKNLMQKQILADKARVNKHKIEVEKMVNNKLPIYGYHDHYRDDLSVEVLLPMNRWLLKYPNVTLINMAPFTPTGDINDALFSLPSDVAANPTKSLRVWIKFHRAFDCGVYLSGLAGQSSRRVVQESTTTSKHFSEQEFLGERSYKQDEAMIYYQNLIKRTWCFNTGFPKGAYVWNTITDSIGTAVKDDSEMKRRHELDTDLTLMAKRRQALSMYFGADSNHFCLFAQRMRQNMIDLEQACSKVFIRKTKARKFEKK